MAPTSTICRPTARERSFTLGALLGVDPREVGAGTSAELVAAVAAQRSIKEDAKSPRWRTRSR